MYSNGNEDNDDVLEVKSSLLLLLFHPRIIIFTHVTSESRTERIKKKDNRSIHSSDQY